MSAPKATAGATIATVINNIIGGGLLALPFTFKRASLIPGVVAMCVTGILNCTTMILIGTACEISGARNYKELGHICFGARANIVISAIMALYTLGSCVSYIVLIGDNLPDIIQRAGDPSTNPTLALFCSREVLAVMAAVLVLYPLSAQRNLNALRYTARVAFVCILYTVSMIAGKAIQGPRAPDDKVVYMRGGTGLFIGFPITMVAFTMHYNTPRFYFELENHTPARFAVIAALCFGFTIIVYQATAVGGYLLFGVDTKGDVLENFDPNDQLAFAARVALSAVMLFSYPLAFNSYRASFVALMPQSWQERLAAGPALSAKRIAEAEERNGGKPLSWSSRACITARADWPHLACTKLLVVLSVGIAIAIPEIELVLGYKGALGGTVIVYILPGLMFFTMMRRMRAQGMTLSDIARVKKLAGEKDEAGDYMPGKLVNSEIMDRVLEPGEIQLGPPTQKMSRERSLGEEMDKASKAARNGFKGEKDGEDSKLPLLSADHAAGHDGHRDASGHLDGQGGVGQFLSISIRNMRAGTDGSLGSPKEPRAIVGRVGPISANSIVGTWTGDLLSTGYGWLALFLAGWGLMVMVLGTATTAGLIQ